MSVEQTALLQLAEENTANALAFLKKNYPQLAREQLKAALDNIALAEMLGANNQATNEQKVIDI